MSPRIAAQNPNNQSENLPQLIEKLTKRIEAFEQLVQILEAKVQALEAEKGKNETVEWHQVLQVIDGDTIKIETGKSGQYIGVRYIGVDTPGTVDPRKPVEYFGQ